MSVRVWRTQPSNKWNATDAFQLTSTGGLGETKSQPSFTSSRTFTRGGGESSQKGEEERVREIQGRDLPKRNGPEEVECSSGSKVFRSEPLENLGGVPSFHLPKEEVKKGSAESTDDDRRNAHLDYSGSGGRVGGTMAGLIKRFRESPPLSKAERRRSQKKTDSKGRGTAVLDGLPGFWWREESKHHLEKERVENWDEDRPRLDLSFSPSSVDLIDPATVTSTSGQGSSQTWEENLEAEGEGEGEGEGPEGERERQFMFLQDLRNLYHEAPDAGEDILLAWRKRNRMLLKRRGLASTASTDEDASGRSELVAGSHAPGQTVSSHGAAAGIGVPIASETLEDIQGHDSPSKSFSESLEGEGHHGGRRKNYKAFIERLRKRLGMEEYGSLDRHDELTPVPNDADYKTLPGDVQLVGQNDSESNDDDVVVVLESRKVTDDSLDHILDLAESHVDDSPVSAVGGSSSNQGEPTEGNERTADLGGGEPMSSETTTASTLTLTLDNTTPGRDFFLEVEPLLEQVVHDYLFTDTLRESVLEKEAAQEVEPGPLPSSTGIREQEEQKYASTSSKEGEEGAAECLDDLDSSAAATDGETETTTTKPLSPNSLLGVTKYDSDKVVLMLKERIQAIQETMLMATSDITATSEHS